MMRTRYTERRVGGETRKKISTNTSGDDRIEYQEDGREVKRRELLFIDEIKNENAINREEKMWTAELLE